MLRGMKVARTSSAAKSAAPRRRTLLAVSSAETACYTTDGCLIGDGSDEPEPVLPGDQALLASARGHLNAQYSAAHEGYFTHEEVLADLRRARAQRQLRGS